MGKIRPVGFGGTRVGGMQPAAVRCVAARGAERKLSQKCPTATRRVVVSQLVWPVQADSQAVVGHTTGGVEM